MAGVAALIAPVTAQLPAAMEFRQVIAMLVVICVCFLAGLVVQCTKHGQRRDLNRGGGVYGVTEDVAYQKALFDRKHVVI